MGAGSAKGIRRGPDEDDPDGDGFSLSSEQWENDGLHEQEHPNDVTSNNNNKVIKADVNNPGSSNAGGNDGDNDSRIDVEKKEEARRRGIFAFSRKKDDQVKVGDIVDELSNSFR